MAHSKWQLEGRSGSSAAVVFDLASVLADRALTLAGLCVFAVPIF